VPGSRGRRRRGRGPRPGRRRPPAAPVPRSRHPGWEGAGGGALGGGGAPTTPWRWGPGWEVGDDRVRRLREPHAAPRPAPPSAPGRVQPGDG
jgi:hypothetical protein